MGIARQRNGGGGWVVERIIERVASAGPASYPVLTKTNYNDWALLMKIKLQARSLWRAIDPGDDVSEPEDRMALDAICSAVPPEMVSTLTVKPTAKQAWESLRVMRIGDDRVRKSSAKRVRRQYEELALRDGEGVEDFALRLMNIVSQLATLGDPEEPVKVIEKYLRIARKRYKQIVVSMETLLDISTLSIEEVTGRIMASEDDIEQPPKQDAGKLYLTEEQWLERYKQKEQESNRSGGGSSSRGKRRPGDARQERAAGTQPRQVPVLRQDWPLGQRGQEQEERRPSPGPSPCGSRRRAHSPSPGEHRRAGTIDDHRLHLVEERVFAVLEDTPEKEPRCWIFDTGASNHMTGSRAAFSDLDTSIAGTMRFGDGSVVRIEGCGTVLFDCKNGEHRAFPNTYFIPRLTANIISCGQLDEDEFEILIRHGFMRVRDEQRRLLAKIRRGPGRLYVLDLTIARPVCLAAHAWPASIGLLHGDLCGPITPATLSGNRYFLLLINDYSRFMWAALLGSKDLAQDAIKRIQAAAERKSGRKLLALCTDRGGEFTSTQFTEYCAELGVGRQLTAPYTPQQNGVVERRNQTLVGMVRCMLKAKGLPGMFWGEAITTAVYILNRTTTKGTGCKTPYELWTGTTPVVHHL
ncbi:hypothetical protein U9M48_011534 [Paspalum notatum var. saurae]|uniref:Integrase catalytic domain-containing protein n=1 Tax=Paspalum notatum var. saurae TaxID=547442 RepID=A0AAQ3SXQ1_PASNO